jgi:hypothetical protein
MDGEGLNVPVDTIDLKANTDGVTRIYDVLGLNLNLALQASKKVKLDALDIALYGQGG